MDLGIHHVADRQDIERSKDVCQLHPRLLVPHAACDDRDHHHDVDLQDRERRLDTLDEDQRQQRIEQQHAERHDVGAPERGAEHLPGVLTRAPRSGSHARHGRE